MNIMEFLKEYSQLFNTVLLLALIGVLYKIFHLILVKKNAEIDNIKNFTIDGVVDKFKSMKEYYEIYLKSWYENSVKMLEDEKQKAIREKEELYKQKLIQEIKARKQLIDDNLMLSENIKNKELFLSNDDVCGEYSVVGKNYESASLSYSGYLTISRDHNLLNAEWKLSYGKHTFKGKGILNHNSMSFVFGDDNKSYKNDFKGIILYTFITKNIVIGRWSGLLINQYGIEEIRKLS
jgi:hypothetical protein